MPKQFSEASPWNLESSLGKPATPQQGGVNSRSFVAIEDERRIGKSPLVPLSDEKGRIVGLAANAKFDETGNLVGGEILRIGGAAAIDEKGNRAEASDDNIDATSRLEIYTEDGQPVRLNRLGDDFVLEARQSPNETLSGAFTGTFGDAWSGLKGLVGAETFEETQAREAQQAQEEALEELPVPFSWKSPSTWGGVLGSAGASYPLSALGGGLIGGALRGSGKLVGAAATKTGRGKGVAETAKRWGKEDNFGVQAAVAEGGVVAPLTYGDAVGRQQGDLFEHLTEEQKLLNARTAAGGASFWTALAGRFVGRGRWGGQEGWREALQEFAQSPGEELASDWVLDDVGGFGRYLDSALQGALGGKAAGSVSGSVYEEIRLGAAHDAGRRIMKNVAADTKLPEKFLVGAKLLEQTAKKQGLPLNRESVDVLTKALYQGKKMDGETRAWLVNRFGDDVQKIIDGSAKKIVSENKAAVQADVEAVEEKQEELDNEQAEYEDLDKQFGELADKEYKEAQKAKTSGSTGAKPVGDGEYKKSLTRQMMDRYKELQKERGFEEGLGMKAYKKRLKLRKPVSPAQVEQPAATTAAAPKKPAGATETTTKPAATPAATAKPAATTKPAEPDEVEIDSQYPGQPELVNLPVADLDKIKVEPSRFQVKSEAKDEEGGVSQKDKIKGGFEASEWKRLLLWRDKKGELYLAHGHHRLDAAKRWKKAKQLPKKGLPVSILDESKGVSAEQAAGLAARSNLKDGRLTAVDYYLSRKYLKDLDKLPGGEDGSEMIFDGAHGAAAYQAEGLVRLDDDAAKYVEGIGNGKVRAAYAAEIGYAELPADKQIALMQKWTKSPPTNIAQARMRALFAKTSVAVKEDGDQGALMGLSDDKIALASEVAADIVAGMMKKFGVDMRDFNALVKREANVRIASGEMSEEAIDELMENSSGLTEKNRYLAKMVMLQAGSGGLAGKFYHFLMGRITELPNGMEKSGAKQITGEAELVANALWDEHGKEIEIHETVQASPVWERIDEIIGKSEPTTTAEPETPPPKAVKPKAESTPEPSETPASEPEEDKAGDEPPKSDEGQKPPDTTEAAKPEPEGAQPDQREAFINDVYEKLMEGTQMTNGVLWPMLKKRGLEDHVADYQNLAEVGLAKAFRHNAQNILKEHKTSPVSGFFTFMDLLTNKMPSQQRDQDKHDFQQFSTPPALALLAGWLMNQGTGARILEPSAGTGILAAAVNNPVVNEWKRPEYLEMLGGFEAIHKENAKDLPTLGIGTIDGVLMNPPFSADGGKKNSKEWLQHMEAAWNMLRDGGRMVIITGAGQEPAKAKFVSGYEVPVSLVFDGHIYRKMGASYPVRLTVIEKVKGEVETLANPVKKKGNYDYDGALRDVEMGYEYFLKENRPALLERSQADDYAPATPEPVADETAEATDKGGESKPAATTKPKTPKEDKSKPEAKGESKQTSEKPKVEAKPEPKLEEDNELEERLARQRANNITTAFSINYDQIPDVAKNAPRSGRFVQSQAIVDIPLSKGAQERIAAAKENMKFHPDLFNGGIKIELPQGQENPEPLVPYLEQIQTAIEIKASQLSFFRAYGYYAEMGLGKTFTMALNAYDSIQSSNSKKVLYVGQNQGWFVGQEEDAKGKKREIIGDGHIDIARAGIPLNNIRMFSDAKSSTDFDEGVLYSTYSMLKRATKGQKDGIIGDVSSQARFKRVVKWLGGEKFDGMIIFDESDVAANVGKLKKGKGKQGAPSQNYLLVQALQRALPNASVIYASGTPTTKKPQTIMAMSKLPLFGKGTPIADREAFEANLNQYKNLFLEEVAGEIRHEGLANFMAQDRSDVRSHLQFFQLTKDQILNRDKMAKFWYEWAEAIEEKRRLLNEISQEGVGKYIGNLKKDWAGLMGQMTGSINNAYRAPIIAEGLLKAMRGEEVWSAQDDRGFSPTVFLPETGGAVQRREIERAKRRQGISDVSKLDVSEIDMSVRSNIMDKLGKAKWLMDVELSDDTFITKVLRHPPSKANELGPKKLLVFDRKNNYRLVPEGVRVPSEESEGRGDVRQGKLADYTDAQIAEWELYEPGSTKERIIAKLTLDDDAKTAPEGSRDRSVYQIALKDGKMAKFAKRMEDYLYGVAFPNNALDTMMNMMAAELGSDRVFEMTGRDSAVGWRSDGEKMVRIKNKDTELTKFLDTPNSVIFVSEAGSRGTNLHDRLQIKNQNPRLGLFDGVSNRPQLVQQVSGRILRNNQITPPIYILTLMEELNEQKELGPILEAITTQASATAADSKGKNMGVLSADNNIMDEYGRKALADYINGLDINEKGKFDPNRQKSLEFFRELHAIQFVDGQEDWGKSAGMLSIGQVLARSLSLPYERASELGKFLTERRNKHVKAAIEAGTHHKERAQVMVGKSKVLGIRVVSQREADYEGYLKNPILTEFAVRKKARIFTWDMIEFVGYPEEYGFWNVRGRGKIPVVVMKKLMNDGDATKEAHYLYSVAGVVGDGEPVNTASDNFADKFTEATKSEVKKAWHKAEKEREGKSENHKLYLLSNGIRAMGNVLGDKGISAYPRDVFPSEGDTKKVSGLELRGKPKDMESFLRKHFPDGRSETKADVINAFLAGKNFVLETNHRGIQARVRWQKNVGRNRNAFIIESNASLYMEEHEIEYERKGPYSAQGHTRDEKKIKQFLDAANQVKRADDTPGQFAVVADAPPHREGAPAKEFKTEPLESDDREIYVHKTGGRILIGTSLDIKDEGYDIKAGKHRADSPELVGFLLKTIAGQRFASDMHIALDERPGFIAPVNAAVRQRIRNLLKDLGVDDVVLVDWWRPISSEAASKAKKQGAKAVSHIEGSVITLARDIGLYFDDAEQFGYISHEISHFLWEHADNATRQRMLNIAKSGLAADPEIRKNALLSIRAIGYGSEIPPVLPKSVAKMNDYWQVKYADEITAYGFQRHMEGKYKGMGESFFKRILSLLKKLVGVMGSEGDLAAKYFGFEEKISPAKAARREKESGGGERFAIDWRRDATEENMPYWELTDKGGHIWDEMRDALSAKGLEQQRQMLTDFYSRATTMEIVEDESKLIAGLSDRLRANLQEGIDFFEEHLSDARFFMKKENKETFEDAYPYETWDYEFFREEVARTKRRIENLKKVMGKVRHANRWFRKKWPAIEEGYKKPSEGGRFAVATPTARATIRAVNELIDKRGLDFKMGAQDIPYKKLRQAAEQLEKSGGNSANVRAQIRILELSAASLPKSFTAADLLREVSNRIYQYLPHANDSAQFSNFTGKMDGEVFDLTFGVSDQSERVYDEVHGSNAYVRVELDNEGKVAVSANIQSGVAQGNEGRETYYRTIGKGDNAITWRFKIYENGRIHASYLPKFHFDNFDKRFDEPENEEEREKLEDMAFLYEGLYSRDTYMDNVGRWGQAAFTEEDHADGYKRVAREIANYMNMFNSEKNISKQMENADLLVKQINPMMVSIMEERATNNLMSLAKENGFVNLIQASAQWLAKNGVEWFGVATAPEMSEAQWPTHENNGDIVEMAGTMGLGIQQYVNENHPDLDWAAQGIGTISYLNKDFIAVPGVVEGDSGSVVNQKIGIVRSHKYFDAQTRDDERLAKIEMFDRQRAIKNLADDENDDADKIRGYSTKEFNIWVLRKLYALGQDINLNEHEYEYDEYGNRIEYVPDAGDITADGWVLLHEGIGNFIVYPRDDIEYVDNPLYNFGRSEGEYTVDNVPFPRVFNLYEKNMPKHFAEAARRLGLKKEAVMRGDKEGVPYVSPKISTWLDLRELKKDRPLGMFAVARPDSPKGMGELRRTGDAWRVRVVGVPGLDSLTSGDVANYHNQGFTDLDPAKAAAYDGALDYFRNTLAIQDGGEELMGGSGRWVNMPQKAQWGVKSVGFDWDEEQLVLRPSEPPVRRAPRRSRPKSGGLFAVSEPHEPSDATIRAVNEIIDKHGLDYKMGAQDIPYKRLRQAAEQLEKSGGNSRNIRAQIQILELSAAALPKRFTARDLLQEVSNRVYRYTSYAPGGVAFENHTGQMDDVYDLVSDVQDDIGNKYPKAHGENGYVRVESDHERKVAITANIQSAVAQTQGVKNDFWNPMFTTSEKYKWAWLFDRGGINFYRIPKEDYDLMTEAAWQDKHESFRMLSEKYGREWNETGQDYLVKMLKEKPDIILTSYSPNESDFTVDSIVKEIDRQIGMANLYPYTERLMEAKEQIKTEFWKEGGSGRQMNLPLLAKENGFVNLIQATAQWLKKEGFDWFGVATAPEMAAAQWGAISNLVDEAYQFGRRLGDYIHENHPDMFWAVQEPGRVETGGIWEGAWIVESGLDGRSVVDVKLLSQEDVWDSGRSFSDKPPSPIFNRDAVIEYFRKSGDEFLDEGEDIDVKTMSDQDFDERAMEKVPGQFYGESDIDKFKPLLNKGWSVIWDSSYEYAFYRDSDVKVIANPLDADGKVWTEENAVSSAVFRLYDQKMPKHFAEAARRLGLKKSAVLSGDKEGTPNVSPEISTWLDLRELKADRPIGMFAVALPDDSRGKFSLSDLSSIRPLRELAERGEGATITLGEYEQVVNKVENARLKKMEIGRRKDDYYEEIAEKMREKGVDDDEIEKGVKLRKLNDQRQADSFIVEEAQLAALAAGKRAFEGKKANVEDVFRKIHNWMWDNGFAYQGEKRDAAFNNVFDKEVGFHDVAFYSSHQHPDHHSGHHSGNVFYARIEDLSKDAYLVGNIQEDIDNEGDWNKVNPHIDADLYRAGAIMTTAANAGRNEIQEIVKYVHGRGKGDKLHFHTGDMMDIAQGTSEETREAYTPEQIEEMRPEIEERMAYFDKLKVGDRYIWPGDDNQHSRYYVRVKRGNEIVLLDPYDAFDTLPEYIMRQYNALDREARYFTQNRHWKEHVKNTLPDFPDSSAFPTRTAKNKAALPAVLDREEVIDLAVKFLLTIHQSREPTNLEPFFPEVRKDLRKIITRTAINEALYESRVHYDEHRGGSNFMSVQLENISDALDEYSKKFYEKLKKRLTKDKKLASELGEFLGAEKFQKRMWVRKMRGDGNLLHERIISRPVMPVANKLNNPHDKGSGVYERWDWYENRLPKIFRELGMSYKRVQLRNDNGLKADAWKITDGVERVAARPTERFAVSSPDGIRPLRDIAERGDDASISIGEYQQIINKVENSRKKKAALGQRPIGYYAGIAEKLREEGKSEQEIEKQVHLREANDQLQADSVIIEEAQLAALKEGMEAFGGKKKAVVGDILEKIHWWLGYNDFSYTSKKRKSSYQNVFDGESVNFDVAFYSSLHRDTYGHHGGDVFYARFEQTEGHYGDFLVGNIQEDINTEKQWDNNYEDGVDDPPRKTPYRAGAIMTSAAVAGRNEVQEIIKWWNDHKQPEEENEDGRAILFQTGDMVDVAQGSGQGGRQQLTEEELPKALAEWKEKKAEFNKLKVGDVFKGGIINHIREDGEVLSVPKESMFPTYEMAVERFVSEYFDEKNSDLRGTQYHIPDFDKFPYSLFAQIRGGATARADQMKMKHDIQRFLWHGFGLKDDYGDSKLETHEMPDVELAVQGETSRHQVYDRLRAKFRDKFGGNFRHFPSLTALIYVDYLVKNGYMSQIINKMKAPQKIKPPWFHSARINKVADRFYLWTNNIHTTHTSPPPEPYAGALRNPHAKGSGMYERWDWYENRLPKIFKELGLDFDRIQLENRKGQTADAWRIGSVERLVNRPLERFAVAAPPKGIDGKPLAKWWLGEGDWRNDPRMQGVDSLLLDEDGNPKVFWRGITGPLFGNGFQRRASFTDDREYALSRTAGYDKGLWRAYLSAKNVFDSRDPEQKRKFLRSANKLKWPNTYPVKKSVESLELMDSFDFYDSGGGTMSMVDAGFDAAMISDLGHLEVVVYESSLAINADTGESMQQDKRRFAVAALSGIRPLREIAGKMDIEKVSIGEYQQIINKVENARKKKIAFGARPEGYYEGIAEDLREKGKSSAEIKKEMVLRKTNDKRQANSAIVEEAQLAALKAGLEAFKGGKKAFVGVLLDIVGEWLEKNDFAYTATQEKSAHVNVFDRENPNFFDIAFYRANKKEIFYFGHHNGNVFYARVEPGKDKKHWLVGNIQEDIKTELDWDRRIGERAYSDATEPAPFRPGAIMTSSANAGRNEVQEIIQYWKRHSSVGDTIRFHTGDMMDIAQGTGRGGRRPLSDEEFAVAIEKWNKEMEEFHNLKVGDGFRDQVIVKINDYGEIVLAEKDRFYPTYEAAFERFVPDYIDGINTAYNALGEYGVDKDEFNYRLFGQIETTRYRERDQQEMKDKAFHILRSGFGLKKTDGLMKEDMPDVELAIRTERTDADVLRRFHDIYRENNPQSKNYPSLTALIYSEYLSKHGYFDMIKEKMQNNTDPEPQWLRYGDIEKVSGKHGRFYVRTSNQHLTHVSPPEKPYSGGLRNPHRQGGGNYERWDWYENRLPKIFRELGLEFRRVPMENENGRKADAWEISDGISELTDRPIERFAVVSGEQVNVRYNINETKTAKANRFTIRRGDNMHSDTIDIAAEGVAIAYDKQVISQAGFVRVRDRKQRDIYAALGGRIVEDDDDLEQGKKIGFLPFGDNNGKSLPFFYLDDLSPADKQRYLNANSKRQAAGKSLAAAIRATDIDKNPPEYVIFGSAGVFAADKKGEKR